MAAFPDQGQVVIGDQRLGQESLVFGHDAILFPVQHGMLYFTGMDVLPPFIAWSPARADEETRTQYFLEYKERLSTLETTQPLVFDM